MDLDVHYESRDWWSYESVSQQLETLIMIINYLLISSSYFIRSQGAMWYDLLLPIQQAKKLFFSPSQILFPYPNDLIGGPVTMFMVTLSNEHIGGMTTWHALNLDLVSTNLQAQDTSLIGLFCWKDEDWQHDDPYSPCLAQPLKCYGVLNAVTC